MDNVVVKA